MSGRAKLALLAIVVAGLAVSGIHPYDRLTWLLEVAPVFIALPILIATHRRFPLSGLAYALIAVHALILCLGGHYTYARVPMGAWAAELFGWQRNHYDRLGHVAQGFVPAIVAREVLLRTSPLKRGGWLSFLVVCVVLAISALYELVEWWAALVSAEAAAAFLGTQGDVWDTQWDMFLALAGAVAALLTLSRLHDRSLVQVERESRP
jgi:putative membrane protein